MFSLLFFRCWPDLIDIRRRMGALDVELLQLFIFFPIRMVNSFILKKWVRVAYSILISSRTRFFKLVMVECFIKILVIIFFSTIMVSTILAGNVCRQSMSWWIHRNTRLGRDSNPFLNHCPFCTYKIHNAPLS